MVPNNSHPAIVVRDIRVSFLGCTHLKETLLSFSLVFWVAELLGLFKEARKRKDVLKGLSFQVNTGTIHGLFGVNGSGKTTTAQCLIGNVSPSSGQILVFGDNIQSNRHRVLEVLSKGTRDDLYKEFTPLENIEFAARLYGLEVNSALSTATYLLTLMGLDENDCRHSTVDQLSVGGRAKVSIVRALLPVMIERTEDGRAPILLLDEPTLGMDVGAVESFFAAIRSLRAANPRLTIVIATNDPREAAQCDDYTAIVNGKAVHDRAQLESLKLSMNHAKSAFTAFHQMLSVSETDSSSSAPQAIPAINRKRYSSVSSFNWRSKRDLASSPTLMVLVILSLVLPNTLAAFVKMSSNSAGNHWAEYVMLCIGIYASMIMRESFRFLSRENVSFHMLELVTSAPITRLQHWRSVMVGYVTIQTVMALAAAITIGGGMLFNANFRDVAFESVSNLTMVSVAQLALSISLLVLALLGLGLVTSLVPFTMKSDESFFLLGMLPLLVVATSGVYYDPSILPPVLKQLADYNALSYGSNAIREILTQETKPLLPLGSVIQDATGIRSHINCNLLALGLLALAYLTVSIPCFTRLERFVRRLNRFRAG